MKNSERKAATREATLVATLETLEAVGYNRLRTSDVATRSGMSEGTLFHYFPTKYLLVAAALDRALDGNVQRALVEYEEMKAPFDRRVLVEILWRLLSDNRIAWTYELFGAMKTDPQLQEIVGPVLHANSLVIDELAATIGITAGRLPREDADIVVGTIIWSLQGLILRNMGRGSSGEEKELIDYIVFLADRLYPMETEPTATETSAPATTATAQTPESSIAVSP